MLKVRLAAASLGIGLLLTASATLLAQTSSKATVAPPPSQILTAKKVFIANGGGGFDKEIWNGDPSRTYNEFYGAIKSWGHYEIVGTPADADLVLQISIASSPRISGGEVFPWFQARLELLDPKTNVLLWASDEFIPEKPGLGMILKKNRDKEFSEAIGRIITNLKTLTGQPAAINDSK
jgi:hypothetical protein